MLMKIMLSVFNKWSSVGQRKKIYQTLYADTTCFQEDHFTVGIDLGFVGNKKNINDPLTYPSMKLNKIYPIYAVKL